VYHSGVGVLDEIRRGAAEVMAGARCVRVDAERLEALAGALAAAPPAPAVWDVAHHHRGTPASTLAYVLTLDAINFGSGWFPWLRKRGSLSGYFTIAGGLKRRFDNDGPWRAAELAELSADDLAPLLDQDLGVPEVAELMRLFAEALNELGEFLLARHAGRFEGPVEEAGGSAERLVGVLSRMSFWNDVQSWRGRRVPFFKRAQLAAADLSLALGGKGLGAFCDLDRLTVFADNLVPHVLRCEGVLVYAEDLGGRIDREVPLQSHSEEEVEIRAGAVHAVELLVAALRARGTQATAHGLDYWLWHRGQRPELKSRPRHRARSVFY
jgi:hypothetical protein